jgi:hypothetical protein
MKSAIAVRMTCVGVWRQQPKAFATAHRAVSARKMIMHFDVFDGQSTFDHRAVMGGAQRCATMACSFIVVAA